jgi:hypothetical protein
MRQVHGSIDSRNSVGPPVSHGPGTQHGGIACWSRAPGHSGEPFFTAVLQGGRGLGDLYHGRHGVAEGRSLTDGEQEELRRLKLRWGSLRMRRSEGRGRNGCGVECDQGWAAFYSGRWQGEGSGTKSSPTVVGAF